MTLRLDLTAMRSHELQRALPRGEYLMTRPALALARLAHKPVFSPDAYPETLELLVAQESDWDALGASLDQARAAREMRDALQSMDFAQVGAFRLEGMPYPRNFFAYTKAADTFGALYVSDASGPAPYLELFTVFRAERGGIMGIVTSSAGTPEPLDPSEHLVWLPTPNSSPEQVFQLHRGKVLELGKANRRAQTDEDFRAAYLDIASENFRAWRERGVLKPVAAGETK
jgi:hypothetical protein